MVTKTSIMLGLGETDDQIRQTMQGDRFDFSHNYHRGHILQNLLTTL